MYVIEIMDGKGRFVPAATGDSSAISKIANPTDIWRLYNNGVLVAESLGCRYLRRDIMEFVLEQVTKEKWAAMKKAAEARDVVIRGEKGDVKINGIMIHYEHCGTTLKLEIEKPWYVPESVIRASLNAALRSLEDG